MLKIKNSYLAGLLLVGLLVGCGGGTSSSDNDNGASEQTESRNDNNNERTEQSEGRSDNNRGQQEVEDNGGTGASTPNTPTAPPPSTAQTFTANVMPILNAQCKRCHGDNGRFSVSDTSGTYANISDLKGSVKVSAQYLLDKGSNTVGHGGGQVIAPSSMQYNTIKSWIDSGADFN